VLEGNVPNVVTRYGLDNGRVGYWDPDKGAAIIEDGMGGTVFTPAEGYSWFTDILEWLRRMRAWCDRVRRLRSWR
jgi:hypothetical protein